MKRRVLIIVLLTAVCCLQATAESILKKFGREYTALDTNYVEPHNYMFTVQLCGTYKDGGYRMTDGSGHKLTLREENSFRVGPYVGYKWLVVGYQWDAFKGSNKNNSELSFDFYLPIGGITFYSKKNTNEYTIKGMKYLGEDQNIDYSDQVNGTKFNGMVTSSVGLDLYYVLNHKKYSMRAAYSQTTRQRMSAGSWMLGMGYNRQKIEMDYNALRTTLEDKIGESTTSIVDTSRATSSVSYRYLTVQGGYGYNWVFAKNWLFNASLLAALGYVHYMKVNFNGDDAYLDKLNLSAFNKIKVDGTLRLGLVWNNGKVYAGTSALFHGYTFDIKELLLVHGYATVKAYVGFNFNIFKKKKTKL